MARALDPSKSMTIGKVTKYRGTAPRSLRGRSVEIVAVLKNALSECDPATLVTDREIEASGGVTTLDRILIAVIAPDGVRGPVAGSVRAIDLECFHAALRSRGTT